MDTDSLFGFLLISLIFIEGNEGFISGVRSRKCPPLTISKAKIKPRNRNRVGRVVCLSGYQLLGDKFVFCEEGRWAPPLPTCIKSGCPPMDRLVPNSNIIESYNGALVEVGCIDGFTLSGPSVLSCNGVNWNDTKPSCYINKEFLYKSCDFESDDLCGWRNDFADNFDWKKHSMATPSGHTGTGPEFDHTHGAGVNGKYLYIEASNRNIGDVARLVSPLYTNISANTTCFSFWYHMFGAHIGSLNVYIDQDLSFSESGNHGNHWIKAVIPINTTSSSFHIIIDGVRGTGYAGDIAIDDLKLSESVNCLEEKNKTEVVLSGSCLGRCYDNSTTDADSCYCHDDCHTNNTCCADFLQICGLAKTSSSGSDLIAILPENPTTILPILPNTTSSFFNNSTIINQLNFNVSKSFTDSTPVQNYTTISYVIYNITTKFPHQNFDNETLNSTSAVENKFTHNLSNTVSNSTTPIYHSDVRLNVTEQTATHLEPSPTTSRILTTEKTLLSSTISDSFVPKNKNILPLGNASSERNQLSTSEVTSNINFITTDNNNRSITVTIQPTIVSNADLNTSIRILVNSSDDVVYISPKTPSKQSIDDGDIMTSTKNQTFTSVTTSEFKIITQINSLLNSSKSSTTFETQVFSATTPVNLLNNTIKTINQNFGNSSNTNFQSSTETNNKLIKNNYLMTSSSNNSFHNDNINLSSTKHFSLSYTIVPTLQNNTINNSTKIHQLLEFVTPEPPVVFRAPQNPVKSNKTEPRRISIFDIFKISSINKNRTTGPSFYSSTTIPLAITSSKNSLLNNSITQTILVKSFPVRLNNQTINSSSPTKFNSTWTDTKIRSGWNVLVPNNKSSLYKIYTGFNKSTILPINSLNKSTNVFNPSLKKWQLFTRAPKTSSSTDSLKHTTKSFFFYDAKGKVINNNLDVIPKYIPKVYKSPVRLSTTSSISVTLVPKSNSTILNPTTQVPLNNNTIKTTAKNRVKEMYDNYWRLNISSVEYASKWRLKYAQKGNQASYYREDNSGILTRSTIIGTVLAGLTLVVIVCAVGYLMHKRRVNRNARSDDDADIQFFTSDEILNFNLARPSPDREDRQQRAPKPPRPQRSVPQDCIRLVEQ